jgi:coenzyme F420-0:L-glutamate ligase/coenzyme F420-1:gamma-L-glutamate ligase
MNLQDKFRFYQVLHSRRSTRKLSGEPISKKTIKSLVHHALAAPSAHNAQPTRFVILTHNDTRKWLVEEILRLFVNDLRNDNLSMEKMTERYEKAFTILNNAPTLIIVCLSMQDMRNYSDEDRRSAEYIMAVQSTAAAIQNFLLSAHAEGLGACWLCAPLFCRNTVKTMLHLPPHYDPQAFVALGYPREYPFKPKRKSLDDIILEV